MKFCFRTGHRIFNVMFRYFVCISLLVLIWACQTEDAPDFNAEVRPILNRSCLPCHGGVKQSGGISFLFREEALTEGRSGKMCIVPGHPEKSELMARITVAKGERFMPLEGAALTEAEVDILRRWIKSGAQWDNPWSYRPVAQTVPPEVDDMPTGWSGPVDRFLLRKMRAADLSPQSEAAPHRLIRRLSLDLIGLPPRPEWVEAYERDPSPATYAAIVDTLLASPHFGERWSAPWLDLSRYADTKGYERDGHRNIWRYRDWLIDAHNRDMPYDSFVIRQLAGDLLPGAEVNDLIATAFHRNTMSNDEGGTDNEEFRVQAVMDRVNTTWTVFLGTTMNCVQCHAHPYDPLRHEDYYTSLAVFNNDADEDTHHDSPVLHFFPQPDSARILELEDFIESMAVSEQQSQLTLTATRQLLRQSPQLYHPHYFDSLDNAGHNDAKWLMFRPDSKARLPRAILPVGGGYLFTHNTNSVPGSVIEVHLDRPDGPIIATIEGSKDYRRRHQMTPLSAPADDSKTIHDLWFVYPAPPDESAGNMSFTWFTFLPKPAGATEAEATEWADRVRELYDSPERETLPILAATADPLVRTTQLFIRGNRLTLGDTVRPGVPATLAVPGHESIQNRLDFAQWLTDPDHPLTARVAVNRYWAALFGTGLVETAEDFGSQGTPPSHPELLDYLAYTFVHEDDWSVKSLLRRLVTTAAYRQSPSTDSLRRAVDPANRLLASGPRRRLTAEQLRDQALALSGLLEDTLGGPSVMPPQPEGVWKVVYSGERWVTNEDDLYRRGLYTYWRRTSPYPSMETFDGSSREVCTVRRIPTNTPLQALVTLNDPVYLEAATALVRSRLADLDQDPASVVQSLFRELFYRAPQEREASELVDLYDDALAYYQHNTLAADSLLAPVHPLAVNLTTLTEAAERPRAAALVTVANTLLNIDELLTK